MSSKAALTFARSLLLGASVLTLSAATVRAEDGQCLDQLCHMISLPSLDAMRAAEGTPSEGSTIVIPEFNEWGFNLKGMDAAVKPGDNFPQYAAGTALANMTIPADRSGYGSFYYLDDLSNNRLQALITTLASKPGLEGDDARIAAIYNGMMDTAARDAADIAPVYPNIRAIRALKTHKDMAAYMGATAGDFGSAIIGIAVGEDDKNPSVNALFMFQGGLTLPDRDYYLDEKFAAKKAAYLTYVTDLFTMIGYADPAGTAKAVVDFETRIAEASWTRIESRDPDKTYNPMTWAELNSFAPGFDWKAFARGSGTDGASKIILSQNTAITKIAAVYAATPIETLKAWQTFKTVNEAAPYLSARFDTRRWEFFGRDLSGAQAMTPMWKRAIAVTEQVVGESLGKAYVAEYFPADSKTKMATLVANLKVALGHRIDALDWMSAETKARAHEKLDSIGVKIGYPDVWRDYSALNIVPADLVGNVRRSSAFQWNLSLAKIDKPVDPNEWGMFPQTVNAYYSPTRNEIVFPAAILQPPFFNPDVTDMAVNYGGIGGVIGHELTHGFDDQGRKYAADGSLTDWWQPQDSEKFESEAAKLGAQYDTYEPLPGAKVQGALTMGENIADLGGILLGLDAYRLSLGGTPAPLLDGFTGDQRVFLGWAQVWTVKMRDETVRQRVVSDPHSPAMFRIIGPMRNIDAWYEAFGVKEGDAYYLKPEDRVRIW